MFFKKFPYEDGVTYGTDYLNDNVLADFKKFGPVGTRDIHTKNIFDKLDIRSYFSGCLTLTIEKFKDIEKENYIVVNGLCDDEIEYIKCFSDENWDTRKKKS